MSENKLEIILGVVCFCVCLYLLCLLRVYASFEPHMTAEVNSYLKPGGSEPAATLTVVIEDRGPFSAKLLCILVYFGLIQPCY